MNMPRLLETNASLLRRFCKTSEVNTIMKCYDECTGDGTLSSSPKFEVSASRSTIMSKRRELSTLTRSPSTSLSTPIAKSVKRCSMNKNRSHPQVATAIDILWKSTELRMFAKDTFKMNVTVSAMFFLEEFRILRDLLLSRMNTSLSSQRHRDIELRKIWVKNEALKEKFRQLEAELEILINKYNNELVEKDKIIADCEKQIKHLRSQFEDQHNECIKTSEAIMRKKLHASVMAQDDTLTSIEDVQRKIDKILPAHLDSEKKLRMKRLKLQARLNTQITKFDDAMLMRQAECDKLIAEIKEGKARLAKIREKVDEQEERYQTMIDEQMDAKQWEWNAKRHYVLMVQCARRIQRWWRACKARIDAKKAAEKAERKKVKAKGKAKAKAKGKTRRK